MVYVDPCFHVPSRYALLTQEQSWPINIIHTILEEEGGGGGYIKPNSIRVEEENHGTLKKSMI